MFSIASSKVSKASKILMTLAGVPSSKRSYVFVVNHNGVPNIGADNIHFEPIPLYHSPSSAKLPEGQLEPKEIGLATPKAQQPKEFQKGSPQFTPQPTAALIYTGSFLPSSSVTLYEMFANPVAAEHIKDALETGKSNEFVTYVEQAMSFSSTNASSMGGNDRRAVQLTEAAMSSKDFNVQMRETTLVEMDGFKEQMRETAKTLRTSDGTLRTFSKNNATPFNAELNENMKS